ncbi:MAG: GLPGLI family protein [Prevotellaceae bacterium]|jgi:GLPGLI family protein|nr:GLPGLI family protein [Prevotellaceae bacterium]
MKSKILIAATVCACLFNQAKSQTIRVIYEMQPKIQLNTGDLDKNIIEQIRKKSKTRNILCYNNGESIFKPVKNEDENSSSGINIQIGTSGDITYKNHNTNREVASKNFFGKSFLIENELENEKKWEITDSVKDIQGYTCKKAISKNDEKETAVWFCPNLPIKDGPVYTGLDGLVLEMISDNLTFVAMEILIDADCQITVPDKGEKISKEKFDKMVEKRMKAMEQSAESGGGMVIKITK